MLQILLHSTEELKFSHLQKEIAALFFDDFNLIYQIKPLWIPFPESKDFSSCKEEAKKINSVQIDSPVFSEEEFYCPVKIELEGCFINSKLILCRTKNQKTNIDLKKINATEIKFPLRLKVFRLGKSVSQTENSICLEDSVWKKIIP